MEAIHNIPIEIIYRYPHVPKGCCGFLRKSKISTGNNWTESVRYI